MDNYSAATYPFLQGGGEMGQRTRTFDWNHSVLGSPDGWPQSLRTTLSILLNSRFPMFLFWGTQHICFYNDAYRPSLGNEGKHPQALGQPGELVWPDIWTTIKPLLDQVMRGGEATYDEDRLLPIFRNGQLQEVYWTASYSPVMDEAGSISGVFATCFESTEKVLNTARLQQSNQRFRESERQLINSFEQVPVGIALIWGEELVFEMVNSFYARLMGRPTEALLGQRLLDALPEMAGQDFDQWLREVVTTGQPFVAHEAPVQVLRGNQTETIYVDHTYQPRRNQEGIIIGVLVVVIDVTQQVRTRKAIEESEAHLRNAIELAQLGTWTMNVVTGQMSYSERLQSWLGVEEAVLGRLASPRVHPKDRERVSQAIEKALTPGGSGRYEETYTITNALTGQEHIIHASGQAVFDETGRPVSLSGTAQDVTLQQQLQLKLEQQVQQRTQELASTNQELLQLTDRLQRSNESLQQFAYVASHDLQEPLRKIQSFGDMLKSQYADSLGDGEELLTRMQLAAKRMSSLIRDLLAYSRLSTQQDDFKPVSLDATLQTVLQDLELAIEDSQATITSDPLPTVLGDATQLGQLLANLLSNALKFRRKQADGTLVAPVVTISCQTLKATELPETIKPLRQAAWYYCIAVSDNGIGFEPRYAAQIFGLFQRLHGKNEYAGTGIGLGICEQIVRIHGGAIVAKGRPGQGATFTVCLPG